MFFLSVFPDRCGREQTKQKQKHTNKKKTKTVSRAPPTSRRYGFDSSFSARCQATRHVPTPPAAFRELLIHKKFSAIKKKGKKKEDDDPEGDQKRLGDAYERVYNALFKARKVAGSSRHNHVTIVPQSINGFSAALGATRSRPARALPRRARPEHPERGARREIDG